jgi:hypothetical protein
MNGSPARLTIAVVLNGSPVGLLSWIVEKLQKLRSSDGHGDVETRFSKGDLLTTVMIYWVTQSYGTSARYYHEAAHHPWKPVHERMPVIEAPTDISVLPAEFASAPRRWIQRYYNLKQRQVGLVVLRAPAGRTHARGSTL